ncbi:antifreeze protein [Mycena olivaceomarginata]|nr:antifreeze protein [Mycena olivaceomarginata]
MISSTLIISFLTALSGVSAVGPAAVNLRTAANFAVLAKSGVSTVPPSVITGNVAVSPIAATVVGHLFASSYAVPTPATLTAAISDMGTAFTDATGRVNPNFSNLATGAIGGLILAPGLYKWTTGVTWIFQVAGTLTIAAGKRMTLAGGALASNIVWVVSGSVTAAAGSHIEGVVLGKTSITLQTGATANSRLLAQTAVALQKATVND